MERLSVHHKCPKQSKAKKKPIKIVYISNPMKVKTSASEFRALVHRLTGRDSDITDMLNFPMNDDVDEGLATPQLGSEAVNRPRTVVPNQGADPSADRSADPYRNAYKNVAVSPFEGFDDVFTAQMLENFPGFMPSSIFYEPQVRNFDAM